MNTTSGKPDLGVDREHHAGRAEVAAHHPLHAGRQRDVVVREALVHAVGDRAVVVERGEHLAASRAARRRCRATLRKVSCWPANDASGRSSAVADERTAKRRLGVARRRAARTPRGSSASRSAGTAASTTAARISRAGRGQRAHVVGVEAGEPRADPLGQAVVRRGMRGTRRPWWRSRRARARPASASLADHLAEARRSCRRPAPGRPRPSSANHRTFVSSSAVA